MYAYIRYTNVLGCEVYGYRFGSSSLGFEEGYNDSDKNINCTHPKAYGWFAASAFVLLVTLSSFVLLNVFIGLVAIAMEESKVRQKKEAKSIEKLNNRAQQLGIPKKELFLYEKVFQELNHNKNGKLDSQDIKSLIRCLPMLFFAMALMPNSEQSSRRRSRVSVCF